MSFGSLNGDELAKAAVTRNGLLLGLLTLILVAFLLAGCAGATGSNFAGGAATASGLAATPSSVSFGSVNTGGNSTRSVTVTNPSASSVTISNVSVSGAGFNASGVPAGLILTPGQNAALALTFAPAGAGSVTGKVTVATNSSNTPLAIALSGTGITLSSHTVTLTWHASTSSVAGYRAYRAMTSGGPYTPLHSTPNPQTRWTDAAVQAGTIYYYVVTSVAANSLESAYSNQTVAAIPKT